KFVMDGDQGMYLNMDKEDEMDFSQSFRDKGSACFSGIQIPDFYLIHKVRPTWFEVSTIERTDILFKYIPVPQEEMKYILEAECLANKLEDFLDFCTDLSNPNDRSRIANYKKKIEEKAEAESKRIRKEKRAIHDKKVNEEREKREKEALEKKKLLI